MLNICEMAKDTAIVTMEGEKVNRKPYPSFQMVPFPVTSNPHFKVTIIFNVKY